MSDKPVVLIVLDGWGINRNTEWNAIASAQAPVYDSLIKECPNTELRASGEAVGLPDGQMGNSEVGHLNLGAGRVVYQDSTEPPQHQLGRGAQGRVRRQGHRQHVRDDEAGQQTPQVTLGPLRAGS